MDFDDDRAEEAIERANQRWDNVHKKYDRSDIKYDNWLDLFDRAIMHCKTPIIDLGCGSGNDTLYLIEKGKNVIPCDYSQKAIENIKANFPEVKRAECFDMSKGLPFEDNFTDIIISDLSLHYFTEQKTMEIIEDLKRVLKPNGLLIYRVNSIKDVNHGAGQGKEVEQHLYETSDGRVKRFFDEKDIRKYFSDWESLYLHEETMGRYEHEKVLWRGVAKVNK